MRLLNLVKPIMFTFAILVGFSALAQEPVNCRAEVDKVCSPTQAGGKGAVLKCLSENQEKIPVVCKLEIERFIRAAQQTQDQSEGALATIGGLNAPNPPFPTLALESSYFGGDYSLSNSRLNLTSPFAGGETETWTASLAGGHVAIGSNPVLSNGDLIPKTLDRVEVALQYEKKLPGYRRWSVKGSVGSSGDELFKSGKDSLLSLNLQYGYPSKGGGFWTYFLFLSNNSPFGSFVPIPGVLYVIRTPTFTGLFGIPIVSLQWNMTP
ncbi:MAG: hypothetical protein EOP05_14865 [Proteobacteria bacterium]|nr:MAG: hypothetical protein EOP05_14865 [Pseudomonadota bacterium]